MFYLQVLKVGNGLSEPKTTLQHIHKDVTYKDFTYKDFTHKDFTYNELIMRYLS